VPSLRQAADSRPLTIGQTNSKAAMTDATKIVNESEEIVRPRIIFESITFSDGQSIHPSEDEIIVLVGPNNAGKSAALRELQSYVARPHPQTVVTNSSLKFDGTSQSFLLWLEKNTLRTGATGSHHFRGMNYSIPVSHVSYFDNASHRDPVAAFFASRVGTDTRLTGSDPAGSIRLHFQAAEHPIHLLLADEAQGKRISDYFHRAFGHDLVVFRAGGSQFPLMVGKRPSLQAGEDEFSKRFIEELLAHSVPLQEQGDGMRSFATVLLHVLVADNYSIQFLDEPEAFLHPPQARLLGEYITKQRRSRAQLFVATHSPDVLEGILAADSSKVRIVRIQRDGSVNRIKELSRAKTAAIANDPLTRYSGVLSGIFHQRVIVAESESDCLFYSAVLNIPSVAGSLSPDVLFIHANGKDRMQKLASLLTDVDVPVDVIADIDILSDATKLRQLFETLGGNWSEIQSDWNALNNVVLTTRPPLSADQVRQRVEHELATVSGKQPFPKAAERNIKSIFQELSPWQLLKKLGRNGIGRGAPLTTFDRIAQKCASQGLWIVPEGELEGFCRSIEARHGPDFAEKVLTQRDIEHDPELAAARQFVRDIWHSKQA
jgi:hypothetical protein